MKRAFQQQRFFPKPESQSDEPEAAGTMLPGFRTPLRQVAYEEQMLRE
ncbi:hypothetical protein ACFLVX_01205 [Chloroflexota bacterium]